jgi:hypothetical protein
MEKKINNGLQNSIKKQKDWVKIILLEIGSNPMYSGRVRSSCSNSGCYGFVLVITPCIWMLKSNKSEYLIEYRE